MLLGTFKDSGREGHLIPFKGGQWIGVHGGEQRREASGSRVCGSRWSLGPLRGRGYSLLRNKLLFIEHGTPETQDLEKGPILWEGPEWAWNP